MTTLKNIIQMEKLWKFPKPKTIIQMMKK